MAINFNKDSVFNLKPLPRQELEDGILELLVDGERIITAFKTVRDQLIFTNKRIVSIDIQGLTGTRKSYSTLPYSKIQFFRRALLESSTTEHHLSTPRERSSNRLQWESVPRLSGNSVRHLFATITQRFGNQRNPNQSFGQSECGLSGNLQSFEPYH